MDTVLRLHEDMTARLVLSVSGIDDTTVGDCAELEADMAARGVRLSLLVTPRPRAGRGLREAAAWLADRQDALVLHGYDHVAPPGSATFGRRAEFALLRAHEANLRLTAATAVLEQHGLATDIFAPPRWLASPGTIHALQRRRFALCADVAAARDLRTGQVHRGRVFGFGQSGITEPWWCRAMVLGASRLARRGSLLRLAVDAADLRRTGPTQALRDAVDIALHHGAYPCTYRDLVRERIARPAAARAIDARAEQPAPIARAA